MSQGVRVPLDRDQVAERLRIALVRASRRLRQEASPGLSLSLTAVLATVQRHGPLTPSELAAREQLARPGVTRAIARLREEGLLDATTDAEDGRSYRVTITPRGEKLLREARGRSKRFLSRALRDVDERELGLLADAAALLERLMDER
jgi:DNA-binding MarR family transcriptional regulator